MNKKLCIALKISNLVLSNHYSYYYHAMHNRHANFVKILEICKNLKYLISKAMSYCIMPMKVMYARMAMYHTLWRILKGKWKRPVDYETTDSLFYCTNRALASVGTKLFVNYSYL